MIYIEISVNETSVFWDKHIKYLIEDEIVTDKEDIEYFLSSEYRDFLENRMIVDKDRHYIAYFFENDVEIGAVQFTIYNNKDGKYFGECFIMDFGYILSLEINPKVQNVLKNWKNIQNHPEQHIMF